jgi:hypothetical protein
MNDARKNPEEETSGEKVIEPGERIKDPQLRAHLLNFFAEAVTTQLKRLG